MLEIFYTIKQSDGSLNVFWLRKKNVRKETSQFIFCLHDICWDGLQVLVVKILNKRAKSLNFKPHLQ